MRLEVSSCAVGDPIVTQVGPALVGVAVLRTLLTCGVAAWHGVDVQSVACRASCQVSPSRRLHRLRAVRCCLGRCVYVAWQHAHEGGVRPTPWRRQPPLVPPAQM